MGGDALEPIVSSNDRIYIGRQPILDAGERVVAYEMLFRGSADAQTAVFTDQHAAAMRVMVNTFASMGADAVLGPCLGFFNVTREVLLGEMIEALPRDRVTLEILEAMD